MAISGYNSSQDVILGNGSYIDMSALNEITQGQDFATILQPQEMQQVGPTAEQVAENRARESFNTGKTNIYDTARNAAGDWVGGQRNNILDFINGLRTGQGTIDNARINNTINQQRGTQGVLGMVGRGIQSGGVMLANRNASNSSAAEAIARAYGNLGQREQTKVNDQYFTQDRNIGTQQQALDMQRESGVRRFSTDKDSKVNEIVGNAQNAFATLNQQAAGAGIAERIAIEQEKEAIRNQVIQQLAVLDNELANQSSVQAMGGDAIRSRATELNNQGVATPDQFQFNDQAPMAFQQGPSLGNLPIYTNRRRGY